jgi:hypothetical protein
VVAQGEELGQYRYSVHYKQLVLSLIALKEIVVLGLTIPKTERHLAAIWVTSETAGAQRPRPTSYDWNQLMPSRPTCGSGVRCGWR